MGLYGGWAAIYSRGLWAYRRGARLLHTPRKVAGDLCLTRARKGEGGSQEVAVGKRPISGRYVRVAKETSQKKVSLRKPRGGQCQDSAVMFRVDGEKGARERGPRCSRVMATAAAPACLRCVPSFCPTLQAPPPPPSVTKSSFPPRPLEPGLGLPLGKEKHVGLRGTLQPGRMWGGGSQVECAAWGGAS